MPSAGYVLIGFLTFATCLTLANYAEEIHFVMKHFRKSTRKRKTVWILAFFPVRTCIGPTLSEILLREELNKLHKYTYRYICPQTLQDHTYIAIQTCIPANQHTCMHTCIRYIHSLHTCVHTNMPTCMHNLTHMHVHVHSYI